MAKSKFLIFSLALLLAVPVGAATWFAPGTYEPDTACDDASGCTNPATGQAISGGWMYNTPPDSQTTGLRVYLNGYIVSPQGSGVNPNSELLGSRIMPNSLTYYAYFGVWKDCNEDGYIGSALGGLHTYMASTDANVNTAVCPDGSVFNRDGWVYEFQWIGNGGDIAGNGGGNYPAEGDIRWINDTESRVWSDWDLPGHFSPTGSSCPTGPTFGVTSSTGAAIAHVDCIASRKIARTVNDVDSSGSLGLRFEDTSAPYRSKSLLNQDTPVNLFGNPYSGEDNDEWQTGILEYNSRKDRQHPAYDDDRHYDPDQDNRAFDAWDCSQRDTYADPTEGGPAGVAGDMVLDQDGDGVMFTTGKFAPSVNEDPLHSSWYDGANATERGLNGFLHWVANDITGVSNNGLLGANTQTCSKHETTNVWWTYGGVEGGEPGNDDVGNGRSNVETAFAFSLGGQPPRGAQTYVGHPLQQGPAHPDVTDRQIDRQMKNLTGSDSGEFLNDTLGEGYQYGVNFRGTVILRPGWTGTPPWLNTNPINRRDLEAQSGRYITFYGAYGAATTGTGAASAKGEPGIYGFEWCGSNFTSDTVKDGFNCVAAEWKTEHTPNNNKQTVRPGKAYQARDIDCYDGTVVRGQPVYASLVTLSATGPCRDSTGA